ncbi:hypothetical protein GCM10025875_27230 [Litorihabitans aurantiacus]|uniref:Uncharacterized protein n=1 Tax=Litorihabitans aurantiacus TaxID=1930061 RepID=A0AA37XG63_9MICO|nr:hypothetical protein GCM10025875_27230 [Litorihabitans aurantiacus]
MVAATVAGCSDPTGREEPSLDYAIDAAERLLDGESRLEEVLVTPHAGRGSAVFDIPGTELGKFFKMFCLGEGRITLRVNGSDRITDQRCDDGTAGMGLGADGDGTPLDPLDPVEVQLLAADEVYWVATTFTETDS